MKETLHHTLKVINPLLVMWSLCARACVPFLENSYSLEQGEWVHYLEQAALGI